MICDPDPALGMAVQLSCILRLLLDPENMLTASAVNVRVYPLSLSLSSLLFHESLIFFLSPQLLCLLFLFSLPLPLNHLFFRSSPPYLYLFFLHLHFLHNRNRKRAISSPTSINTVCMYWSLRF